MNRGNNHSGKLLHPCSLDLQLELPCLFCLATELSCFLPTATMLLGLARTACFLFLSGCLHNLQLLTNEGSQAVASASPALQHCRTVPAGPQDPTGSKQTAGAPPIWDCL